MAVPVPSNLQLCSYFLWSSFLKATMWNLLHKFVIHFFLVNLCLVVGCQPRPPMGEDTIFYPCTLRVKPGKHKQVLIVS
ncbi:mCG1046235 [Mus musculus]|nr:mCG1046235 [Mus musculus]